MKPDLFEEKYEWKCLICGEKMTVILDGDDSIGKLPCFAGGGTIETSFAYGSNDYDDMIFNGVWQSAIHDECFKKLEKNTRRMIVRNGIRFEKPQSY